MDEIAHHLASVGIPAKFRRNQRLDQLMNHRFIGGVVIGIDSSILYGGTLGTGHAVVLDSIEMYQPYGIGSISIIDPARELCRHVKVPAAQLIAAYEGRGGGLSLCIPTRAAYLNGFRA